MPLLLEVKMPVFSPDSELFICKVPWDNTYKHVRLYEDSYSQQEEIKTMSSFPTGFYQYTYIRWNHSIRVGDVYPEQLQYCNYVMFKNSNTPDARWVYAFIIKCNYLNDKVAELVLETDVWQTYMFDVDFRPRQFIERQHITQPESFTSAYILAPEPDIAAGCGYWQGKEDSTYTDDFTPDKLVICTTADVSYYDDLGQPQTLPQKRVDVYGTCQNGVPAGASYYGFNVAPVGEVGGYQMMRDLNIVGAGNAVADVFLFPSNFYPDLSGPIDGGMGGAYANYREHSNFSHVHRTYNITRPTYYGSIGGVTFYPKNLKTMTYPYCFIRVQAITGEYHDYKWEDFNNSDDSNIVTFSGSAHLSPDAQGVIFPLNYLGYDYAYHHAITFPCTIKCTWTYGAYSNWSAQNKLGNILQGVVGAAMLAVPAGRGIGAAAKALGYARKVEKAGTFLSPYANKAFQAAAQGATPGQAASAAMQGSGLMMGSGAMMLGELASSVYNASAQPDTRQGVATTADMFNAGYGVGRVRFIPMHLRTMQLYGIDLFFTVYGYALNALAPVHITGRQFWNYVKTANCALPGLNIPSNALAEIHRTFDDGIFFWHTLNGFGTFREDNPMI